MSTTLTRRTQAQRRAASRTALLDAAVECLVEHGYAQLTTRRVAQRAGVSQSTQMHHFPTKAAFLAEAVRHLTERMAGQIRAELREVGPDRRHEAVLDLLWRLHTGPVFQAGLELMVAARTDPQLRESLRGLDRDVNRMLVAGAAELFGDDPALLEMIGTGLAAIRGLAMLPAVLELDVVRRRWAVTRRHLLALL